MIELRQHVATENDNPFGLCDYIQIAGMGRRSVRIEVRVAGETGSILVHEGQLWSADLGERQGMEALRVVLDAQQSHVHCVINTRSPGARNLPNTSYEHTLLELARNTDERSRERTAASANADPFNLTLAIKETEPLLRVVPNHANSIPLTIDELLDEGTEALLIKDYPRALDAYQAMLEFESGNKLARANVARLQELIASRETRIT